MAYPTLTNTENNLIINLETYLMKIRYDLNINNTEIIK